MFARALSEHILTQWPELSNDSSALVGKTRQIGRLDIALQGKSGNEHFGCEPALECTACVRRRIGLWLVLAPGAGAGWFAGSYVGVLLAIPPEAGKIAMIEASGTGCPGPVADHGACSSCGVVGNLHNSAGFNLSKVAPGQHFAPGGRTKTLPIDGDDGVHLVLHDAGLPDGTQWVQTSYNQAIACDTREGVWEPSDDFDPVAARQRVIARRGLARSLCTLWDIKPIQAFQSVMPTAIESAVRSLTFDEGPVAALRHAFQIYVDIDGHSSRLSEALANVSQTSRAIVRTTIGAK